MTHNQMWTFFMPPHDSAHMVIFSTVMPRTQHQLLMGYAVEIVVCGHVIATSWCRADWSPNEQLAAWYWERYVLDPLREPMRAACAAYERTSYAQKTKKRSAA